MSELANDTGASLRRRSGSVTTSSRSGSTDPRSMPCLAKHLGNPYITDNWGHGFAAGPAKIDDRRHIRAPDASRVVTAFPMRPAADAGQPLPARPARRPFKIPRSASRWQNKRPAKLPTTLNACTMQRMQCATNAQSDYILVRRPNRPGPLRAHERDIRSPCS